MSMALITNLLGGCTCDVCGGSVQDPEYISTVYEASEGNPFDICADCLDTTEANLLPIPTDEEVRWD